MKGCGGTPEVTFDWCCFGWCFVCFCWSELHSCEMRTASVKTHALCYIVLSSTTVSSVLSSTTSTECSSAPPHRCFDGRRAITAPLQRQCGYVRRAITAPEAKLGPTGAVGPHASTVDASTNHCTRASLHCSHPEPPFKAVLAKSHVQVVLSSTK